MEEKKREKTNPLEMRQSTNFSQGQGVFKGDYSFVRLVGRRGGGAEVGGRERGNYTLTLHCHHQNDNSIKTGNGMSNFASHSLRKEVTNQTVS